MSPSLMELVRVEVVQPAVGPRMVVVPSPRGSAAASIGERLEPVQVEALITEAAVEALGSSAGAAGFLPAPA